MTQALPGQLHDLEEIRDVQSNHLGSQVLAVRALSVVQKTPRGPGLPGESRATSPARLSFGQEATANKEQGC